MVARRAVLLACALLAVAVVAPRHARVASAASFSTPTYTPPAGLPTSTPAPAAFTQTPVVAHATNTTAPVATNTPTAIVPRTNTPTTVPPATPTNTFTPVAPMATTFVLGTPTNTPTAPGAATSTAVVHGSPTPADTPGPSATVQPSATSTWSPTPVDSDTPVPTVTPQGASPYQGQVVINEVLSNPQNVDWDLMGVPRNAQWMELYNTTGSAISVEFWMVRAGDGGMGRATLGNGSSFVIPGQGYLVLYASTLGFELRQNPIALLDTSGAVVDSVSAPSLPGDQSYARRPDDPSSWMVTNNPTLAGPNSYSIQPAGTPDLQATVYAIQTEVAIPLPSPPVAPVFDDDSADASDAAVPARRRRKRSRKGQPFQTLSIAEVRKLPDDTPVITSGVITMPTGLWDLSRAYIQSNGAGLLIHSYGAQRLRLGDTLTIRGRVHHVHGEVEVAAVKGGEQIQPSGVLPAPRPVQPSQVGFGTEALLVQVVGRAEHTQRDYATIADDMGSAHLFLYSRLKFDASTLSGVSLVTITGVVNAEDTRADSGQPDAGGYAQRLLIPTHRLLPRSTADVVMGAAPPGSSTGHVSSPGAVASSSAEASGGSSSFEPRASGSAAMPTPFITPVFSSREPGLANPQTDASNAAVLSLDVPAESGRPWWQWALPALGVALLGAGTAVAFGPRWRNARAAKKEPAEAD